MAKGAIAKDALLARFKAALGSDYLGTDDGKKFYFRSSENGEEVQIAVTMTCPKTPFAAPAVAANGTLDFESAPVAPKVAMQEDEKATLDRLMKELDL